MKTSPESPTHKLLNPFIIDASEHPKIEKVTLINTDSVDNFLSDHDGLLGIASEKGVGKSHLLRLKSKRLRDADNTGAIWIPRNELCEQLERVTFSFTKGQVKVYADPESWKSLWTTAIASVILVRAGIEIPESLRNIYSLRKIDVSRGSSNIDEDLTVESCLIDLLDKDINEYRTMYPTRLKRMITSRIDRRVGVFIDSVDEAFTKHIGETLSDFAGGTPGGGRQGVVQESIWINCQLGLVAAARDLHRANRYISVYFAVRQEALHANRGPLRMQEESLIQHLHYSKDTVKKIFISRVMLIPGERLSKPSADDVLERFLGFGSLPHWRVRDRDGKPLLEEPFDFLYRHTFGRIREVLELGKEILEIHVSERTPDEVRNKVDTGAANLFELYKLDMVPFWDIANEVVFQYLDSNVISQIRLNSIYQKIKSLTDAPKHPFCYLYARGLLGRANINKADTCGTPKINFLEPGTYLVDKNQHLPVCSHYFLHPCLESTVRERSSTFQLDSRIIVGQSLTCDIPEESGELILRWNRRDSFSFIFLGRELRHISPSGGAVYSLIFAVLAITTAEMEKRDISIEEMVKTATRLVKAGLISSIPMRSDETFEDILRFMPRDKKDTGKTYKRDIVEKIKQSLAEVEDHLSNESDNGADQDQYLRFQHGVFHWEMCDPSQINIVQVLRNIGV